MDATECAVCKRNSVTLHKYEFGQKMSYFNWIEGVELANPHYACVYLCSTDYNLAGRVRRDLGSCAEPARILQRMIEYRNVRPIRRKL